MVQARCPQEPDRKVSQSTVTFSSKLITSHSGRDPSGPASRIREHSSPTNNRAAEANLFPLDRCLGRRLAHASRVSTRNPPQLDPAYLPARTWFGSEYLQKRAHQRFPLPPPRNSKTNECPDVPLR